jgi:DNA-binding NtrC family response regulator
MSSLVRDVTVLVVDDEPALTLSLSESLKDAGYQALTASDRRACMERLDAGGVDVVLLDVMLRASGEDGQVLLQEIVSRWPEVQVIMLTAVSDPRSVVRAMRSGAYNYITKGGGDFVQRVHEAVAQAVEEHRDEPQAVSGRDPRKSTRPLTATGIIAESPAMRSLLEDVHLIARSAVTNSVLIHGETGVGKEAVARELHAQGVTAEGQFLAVDPGALPVTMIEAELFGRERGAYTDARTQKAGLFELSMGGTLFLDEIGEVPATVQPKLLRALDSRTFKRLGGTVDIPITARVVAATLRDLSELVASGGFREDLYYRLNIISVAIPPLRERQEDIMPLAHYWLHRAATSEGRSTPELTPSAEQALLAYDWPGNVRELRNMMLRAMVFARGPIEPRDLTFRAAPRLSANGADPFVGAQKGKAAPLTLREAEAVAIRRAMDITDGNITQAARILGCSRQTLRSKLREHSLA